MRIPNTVTALLVGLVSILGCGTETSVKYGDYYPVEGDLCEFNLPRGFSLATYDEYTAEAGLNGWMVSSTSLFLKKEGEDWVMLSYIIKEDSADTKELDEMLSKAVDASLAIVYSYDSEGYNIKVQPDVGIVSRNGVRPTVTDAWVTVGGNRYYFRFAGEGADRDAVVRAMKVLLSEFRC